MLQESTYSAQRAYGETSFRELMGCVGAAFQMASLRRFDKELIANNAFHERKAAFGTRIHHSHIPSSAGTSVFLNIQDPPDPPCSRKLVLPESQTRRSIWYPSPTFAREAISRSSTLSQMWQVHPFHLGTRSVDPPLRLRSLQAHR